MTEHSKALADRLAIQDLMALYGMAVDRRDWALYRTVFTKDAFTDYSDAGGFGADVDKILEWLPGSLSHYAGLQHNMTSHIAEVDGDAARSCTYFLAFHTIAVDVGETLLTMGGYYRDIVQRTPEGWRIATRVLRGVWIDGPFRNPPAWFGTNQHHVPSLQDDGKAFR